MTFVRDVRELLIALKFEVGESLLSCILSDPSVYLLKLARDRLKGGLSLGIILPERRALAQRAIDALSYDDDEAEISSYQQKLFGG
jgi:hypothetical protein